MGRIDYDVEYVQNKSRSLVLSQSLFFDAISIQIGNISFPFYSACSQ